MIKSFISFIMERKQAGEEVQLDDKDNKDVGVDEEDNCEEEYDTDHSSICMGTVFYHLTAKYFVNL